MIATQSQKAVTEADVKEIVNKATFIFERLSDNHISHTHPVNEQEVDKRLSDWCKVIAQGDWEKFQQRLEWDDLTLQKVRQILGTEPNLDEESLPKWASTLTEIIQTASSFNCENISPSPIDVANPYPFEDILLPLVSVARQKLLKLLGLSSISAENLLLYQLSESAYLNLEKALLDRLFNITAKTLEFEFSHSRPLGQNLLNLVIKKKTGTSSKSQYNAFVDKLLSDGLLEFFQKYPVLARFITTIIDFWVEASGEFIERLNNDLLKINHVFSDIQSLETQAISSNQLGNVVEIEFNLSDPHNQNRSVIALIFEFGFKLIYKPKSLGFEVKFCDFLEWCNQQFTFAREQGIDNPHLPFKVLKILNRESYGWVEYAEHLPCEDEAAAQRFYIRAGMLLCLLYVLGGNDCHHENLIACGEHLVLIDMETVMHHEAKLMANITDETAASVATNQLFDSVLRTGLLPMWEFANDNSVAYDLSGLGSVDIQPIPVPMPVWRFINTDDMHKGYEKSNRPLAANIPILDGVTLSPNNYIDELVMGFEQMYRFLIRQREALLTSDNPLAAFGSQQVRFIFRTTKIYGMVLEKATTPECLQNGLSWSIKIDILSKYFLRTDEKPLAWAILSAELRAMGQLDIPYFSAPISGDALPIGQGQVIPEYFQDSCLCQVQARLQKLDDADLAQQVGIIQLAFYAREARTLQTALGNSELEELGDYPASLLTSEQLLQQAQNIASEIQKQAISGADGSLSWISLTYILSAERFQLQPLGNTFYDGNCGIALFLAALAHLTGNSHFRDLSLRAIQSLQTSLQTSDAVTAQKFALDIGIGGATGLGSIIYCLVKISQFLKLPQLCEDAERVASLMTSTTIASDRKFDIIGGAAGAILGLLALYQKTENTAVLQRSVDCGQHLLKYCHEAYTLKTTTSKPLTGYSHGAAGIAYSLLRLYAVTQNNAYLDAARDAIAYENKFFYPTSGNWREITPIYNPGSPPVFWTTWCHGSPGIALGRLGSLPIYQTEEILKDIEVALQTTVNNGWQNIDQLCCGNLGRVEVMLVAAQKLNNPQWYQPAQELAAMTVQRAVQTGGYELFDNLPKSVFRPCFFQGTAGIGYQMLRLAYPETMPSMLLWE
ncbi:type 2 lanthipeptide synthetase LanM family protein [aff. Roholtiella sp. LEGE 12411]|uniref:type 2 lanthipeptide synthetase LanM family protein n=1 Tax=aff. Roholtiella sp. LEGE 12411 TaxID=1828822 RepID=UPI001FC87680|nr:type 2 lanthipeptide synthetase LanM family protein [aff. Roholtiella sp. LEGE 12411]